MYKDRILSWLILFTGIILRQPLGGGVGIITVVVVSLHGRCQAKIIYTKPVLSYMHSVVSLVLIDLNYDQYHYNYH